MAGRRLGRWTTSLGLLVVCVVCAPTSANHGALDKEFGPDGTGIASYAERSGANDLTGTTYFTQVRAGTVSLLRQKIVVLNRGGAGFDPRVAVVRQFHASGLPDNEFGEAGRVELSIPNTDLEGADVEVLPNGRILVGMVAREVRTGPGIPPPFLAFALLRSDGSLDESFGDDAEFFKRPRRGYLVLRPPPELTLRRMAVDERGEFLWLATRRQEPSTTDDPLEYARITTSGRFALPTRFPQDVVVSPEGEETRRVFMGTGATPDIVAGRGTITVQGQTGRGATFSSRPGFSLERRTDDGRLDRGFGEHPGVFKHRSPRQQGGFERDYTPSELLRQEDGKYLSGGVSEAQREADPVADFSEVVRLTRDGRLDSSFADGGVLTNRRSVLDMNSLFHDPATGDVMTAGSDPRSVGSDAQLFRFKESGEFDRGFSGDGELEFQGFSEASKILFQPEGRLVVLANKKPVGSGPVENLGLIGLHGEKDRHDPRFRARIRTRSPRRALRRDEIEASVRSNEAVALHMKLRGTVGEAGMARSVTVASGRGAILVPGRRTMKLDLTRRGRRLLRRPRVRLKLFVTAKDPMRNTRRRTARRTLRR